MEALILAAGRGTRMRGLCEHTPKPMLPVGNVPVLEYILEGVERAGVERAWIVVGHGGDVVRSGLENSRRVNVELGFIEQSSPDGTGSAALLGLDHLKPEPFMLLFADILTPQGEYAALARRHQEAGSDAVLAVRHVPDPCAGAAVYTKDGRITRIVEKPMPGTSTTHFDNAGLFIMPPSLFTYLQHVDLSPRSEYELTDAIAAMIERGVFYAIHELDGFWLNLTDPEALVRASAHVIDEVGATLLCPVEVALTPPVVLGSGLKCQSCRLGPNVSVGDGCTIGDGAVVQHSILMPGAVIGAGAEVRHAVLGPGTSIAAGEKLIGTPGEIAVRT